jgi:hypothetical protein
MGDPVKERYMKRTTILLIVTTMLVAIARGAAAEPDAQVIAKITGIEPDVKSGVATIRVPRNDLKVVVDGVALTPFQGLTTWAAFEGAGDKMIVMGDMTLTEGEVNRTMSAALENGLEVTALHNHFFYDRPAIFFMHIGGTGTTEQLATGVRKAFDAVKAAGGRAAAGFDGPKIPDSSTLDAQPLEAILGSSAQAQDGMLKFVFGRKTSMHGIEAGAAMGVNTWAAFAGSPNAAVVDGDFAMLEGELQPVLKTLRSAGVNIVAIHNHMTHEEPRVMFLHYWARGAATELARGIKAALDTQTR